MYIKRAEDQEYSVGIYMFKVNNRNTRTRCEICSTIKTPECHWRRSGKRMNPKSGLQENKASRIFQKTNISYPGYAHTYVCVSGGRKYSFFRKFVCFCVKIYVTPF